MSEVRISAEPRTEFGKGGARRTRRAGKIPAVLYGHGEKPKHIALPTREFAAAIRHGGMTQLFEIDISDGTKLLALPKALQRDPIRDTIDHVDLVIVKKGEKVTVDIRVQIVGEAARGTLVMQDHDRITIAAQATNLPEHVVVSVEGLDAGTHVTASSVTLPDGAELVTDPDLVVAMVTAAPTAAQIEAELGEGEAAAPTEEAPAEAEAQKVEA